MATTIINEHAYSQVAKSPHVINGSPSLWYSGKPRSGFICIIIIIKSNVTIHDKTHHIFVPRKEPPVLHYAADFYHLKLFCTPSGANLVWPIIAEIVMEYLSLFSTSGTASSYSFCLPTTVVSSGVHAD